MRLEGLAAMPGAAQKSGRAAERSTRTRFQKYLTAHCHLSYISSPMASTLPADRLAELSTLARRLARQIAASESELESLLSASERHLQDTKSALARAIESSGPAGPICEALRDQVVHHQAAVDASRRIHQHTRQHQLAVGRLAFELTHPGGTASSERAAHSVLVADDHLAHLEAMATALTDAGFAVRTATNGLEAVLAAYDLQPAVIVMDLMMPVLGGVDATRLIRAIDPLRDACVIAHTATPRFAEQAGSLFTAVLQKPAQPEVMIATVQRYASKGA